MPEILKTVSKTAPKEVKSESPPKVKSRARSRKLKQPQSDFEVLRNGEWARGSVGSYLQGILIDKLVCTHFNKKHKSGGYCFKCHYAYITKPRKIEKAALPDSPLTQSSTHSNIFRKAAAAKATINLSSSPSTASSTTR